MRAILATVIVIAILAAVFVEIIAPGMNWSAAAEPGAVEEFIASRVIDGWVTRNAGNQTNPLPASAENLKAGQNDYREHCAGCHGLDGGGRNQLDAEFYPPIAKLTEDTQEMTDGQLYFIIAKGIRYSAMPAYEPHHTPEQIWRMVLWLRHLPKLSPEEKAAIAAELHEQEERHKTATEAH